MGKEKVVFFCKECGYESAKWLGKCPGCNQWNTFVEEKIKEKSQGKKVVSNIPKSEMKGSVGAGDSFCAASLYGIYKGMSDQEIIEFASAAAACNLFAENSIDGMLPYEEILKVAEKYGRE